MTDSLPSAPNEGSGVLARDGLLAMNGSASLDLLARRLPKAELHLHLEGSMSPATLVAVRAARGLATDAAELARHYDYRGIDPFFEGLEQVSRDLLDPTALAIATQGAAHDAAAAGVRHLELFFTPAQGGRSQEEQDAALASVASSFQRVSTSLGMTGGVIAEFYRPAGPGQAVRTATSAVALRDAGLPLIGVGNDGDYQDVAFAELADGYARARAGGLRLTGHADIPADVADALELGLDRIDHAFDLEHSPDLVDVVVERGVPLTMCLTSNSVMIPDRYGDVAAHPFGRLRKQGVAIALGTDDPPYFFTDLAQEYRSAARVFGWSQRDLGDAALDSLRTAWLSPSQEHLLRGWFDEVDDLIANVCAPAPVNR